MIALSKGIAYPSLSVGTLFNLTNLLFRMLTFGRYPVLFENLQQNTVVLLGKIEIAIS